MKNNTLQCAIIASILSITATSWAQTSVGLGRADFRDNCASCHGHLGRGDGPVQSFLVKPPSDLTTITQRHGGKFPQELIWEVIDGRWSGDGGPHGSREMPVWGQEFKTRAMTQPRDSATIAELQIGDILLTGVRASINPAMTGNTVLLGMSALRHVEFTQRGDQLTLRYIP